MGVHSERNSPQKVAERTVHILPAVNCQQNPLKKTVTNTQETNLKRVNTEFIVGADNKTFVTVSPFSSMIYRPLAQAAAAWSLDSFTEGFLPFPI